MSNNNWQDISKQDGVIVIGLAVIFTALYFLAASISL